MGRAARIILMEDIPTLGQRGQVVQVRSGYARNYLIPRGLAIPATPANLKQYEHLRRGLEERMEKARAQALELREGLDGKTFILKRPTGREDLLFEAVTRDTVAQLLAEAGFDIDRRRILLDHPIKRAGNYRIPIQLYHDVRATVVLNIEPEA